MGASTVGGFAMTGGFPDPILDAQRSFRALLEAIAHPGRIVDVGHELTPPASLNVASAALCLTLLDYDTAIWLDPELAGEDVCDYLRFHTGAVRTPSSDAADFVLATDIPPLEVLRLGSDIYPDRSATLVVQVAAIAADGPLRCSGPGIASQTRLDLVGLDRDVVQFWRDNNLLFPRGVDAVFTAGTRLCCLPRTTRVEG